MAGKHVKLNTHTSLSESNLEIVTKWLSCNGEAWGVGPTTLFASAAALFLYNELEASIFVAGDHLQVSLLEKTMVSTMVLGMLALMIHLWVCSMRFFQYYLDTLIKDSPNVLLEMTTAGLLGSQEIAALAPLTRFLRQQQPQIHITVCWFLSLCYADYVRKHYCQRFNMPYLEQWQSELQERATRQARRTMARAHSFVGAVQRRLCGFTHQPAPGPPAAGHHTEGVAPKTSVEVSGPGSCMWAEGRGRGSNCRLRPDCGWTESAQPKGELCVRLLGTTSETTVDAVEKLRDYIQVSRSIKTCPSSTLNSRRPDARVAVHRTPASLVLPLPPRGNQSLEDFPWRRMATLPFE